MNDEDLIREFKDSKEYKEWQESLLAIIGYSTDEKEDEELADELMADHLNSSLQLQKGLEIARYNASKKLNEDFLNESHGK